MALLLIALSLASADLSPTEQAMLDALNAFRAKQGLPALVTTEPLMQRARAHSAWMARNQNMSHSQGIQENIAYSQRTPKEVTDTWIASGGHNANMRTSHKEVGLGCVRSAGGALYWTQQFSTGSDKWNMATASGDAGKRLSGASRVSSPETRTDTARIQNSPVATANGGKAAAAATPQSLPPAVAAPSAFVRRGLFRWRR